MNASKPLALSGIALLILTMSSCANSGPTIRTIASECGDLQEITYAWDVTCVTADPQNRCDSEETIRQIEAYNAYLKGLCQ